MALVASLFWVLTANRPFFSAALHGRESADPATWGFALGLGVLLFALHAGLVMLLALHRRLLKPVLALLVVATAFASYFIQSLGIYLDPSMLRNVLHTDPAEARELLGWALVPHLLLYAALPLAVLAQVRIVARPPLRALAVRGLALAGLAGVLVAATLAMFQPFSSLMRNHKELRYQITPANWVWSLATVAAAEPPGTVHAKQPIGLDAKPGPTWQAATRPRLVVLVVGETARRANWGLGGYARQTTPELAGLPVIDFADVASCGTNTEVSLPCMFAPVGRRDYDERRIRGSESLLHVAARAGVAVQWRDNQSGCKGVCDGLPSEDTATLAPPTLCSEGHCLDETLLIGLEQRLRAAHGTQLLVLHMLGNHGPSYFRRLQPAFARFQPACQSDDLQACSREQIVNAYDNALLYTDHVLATLVARLSEQAAQIDSTLMFVSDLGESLGERNLFLHGVPYAIAPREQTQVPMVMWWSAGFATDFGLQADCMRERATRPARHDHLFHTVLSLLDVRTALYEPALDLTHGCRTGH